MTSDKQAAIRRITALETRPLRQAVLRPHQALDALGFPGDDDPDTTHLGLFLHDTLAGIASLYREAMPGYDVLTESWRLRGMAIDVAYRNQGYGAILLQACCAHIRKNARAQAASSILFWCTARITARNFYERHGFQIHGAAFALPKIGIHYYMYRHLKLDDDDRPPLSAFA